MTDRSKPQLRQPRVQDGIIDKVRRIAFNLETAADALHDIRRDPRDPSIEIHGRMDAERGMREAIREMRSLR